MKFLVQTEVDEERVTDLITSALEGGSNYWYTIDKSRSTLTGCRFIVDEPMMGGVLCIQLLEPEYEDAVGALGERGPGGKPEWFLSKETAIEGLRVMSEKCPRHFANWIAENDDAETGDVFLQCVCFGELIFG